MKREEAIALLDLSKLTAVSGRKYDEAIDMAIEALKRVVTTDFYVDGAKYSTVCSYGERKE